MKNEKVINNDYLKEFIGFLEFWKTKKEGINRNKDVKKTTESLVLTPKEELYDAFRALNNSLADDILECVLQESPKFFEDTILKLLLAMGYGHVATEEAAVSLGQSGDNGLDGVINQDPLGLDKVYIQAKRYKADNKVSGPDIRNFQGALSYAGVNKGVFVTTSDYTLSALETAEKVQGQIILINGQQLGQLMVKYNIGCQLDQKIEIKKLDEDFFE